ncbi:MAG: type II toxin-antitoxin system MqsA family antitoxin, partial [Dehalococcoidia bacterium]
MKCHFCGAETEARKVTDLYAEGRLYLAVEDVPAEVCRQCGERYYSRDVTKELLTMTEKAKEHAALALPGQRAEVTICQWQARGGNGMGTVNDFWGMLVPPLVGKVFYTLRDKHAFRLEEMSHRDLLFVPSTGKPRPTARWRMERAWDTLTRRGSISLREIQQNWPPTNSSYVAALLAQMPGVEVRLNP